MQTTEHRGFEKPDEVREFSNGRAGKVEARGGENGRLVLQPGQRWSNEVKSIAKTETCEAPIFQHHVRGQLAIRMDGGAEFIAGPGDVTSRPSGHNVGVTGNEPVAVDWFGAGNDAK